MRQEKTKIEYINVDDLKAYERNARTHSDEQVQQVAESIKEFGFTNPVLIDENNELIAGHGRSMAAKSIGMKEVPAIRLKGLTNAQKKALRIADNQLALNAGWDEELLRIELGELQELDFNLDVMGFSDEELDLLLDGTGSIDDDEEHGQDAEEIAEPSEDPVVKPGELWLLGDHQLLCGDSTRIDDLVRLCEEGSVDLYLTDPPYNVAYEGATKDKLTIQNDNMSDENFRKFLVDAFSTADFAMKPGAAFYIWPRTLKATTSEVRAETTHGRCASASYGTRTHSFLGALTTSGSTSRACTAGRMAQGMRGIRTANKRRSLNSTSRCVMASIRR